MICYTKKAEVEAPRAQNEVIKEAKTLGITTGKLNLFEKLQQSVADLEDISIEEWLIKLEKEVIKAIKAN